MEWPESSGMLKASTNVRNSPCLEINRTVPYFEDFSSQKYSDYADMNAYLYDKLVVLSNEKFKMEEKRLKNETMLDDLPDGAITIREANNKRFKYNIQINDQRYWQYHRNNGITKVGFYDE